MSAHRFGLALVALALLAAGSGGLAARAEAAVYWTGGGGSLWAANTDGSMVLGGYPYGISNMIPRWSACGVAVDATHVYWGDQYSKTVGRMELSSTRTGKADVFSERLVIDQALVTNVNTCAVAVGGGRVYWADFDGRIGRANVDGSAVQRVFIGGLPHPCGVAVDAAHIYWTDAESQAIGRAKLDGSEVEPEFIPDAGEACGVAIDAGHLYWSGFGPSAIGRAKLDGSEVEPSFIQVPYYPCGVAVDAASIFWSYRTSPGGAVVGRANLDGSGTATLVSQPEYGAGCGVAVDSRLFQPALPPASLPLRFGKLKRLHSGKLLSLEVSAPARGLLTVRSPKIGWRLITGPMPPWVDGSFRWKLQLWPGKGKVGRRIVKQLHEKGRAPITLRLEWQQQGRTGSEQLKSLAFTR